MQPKIVYCIIVTYNGVQWIDKCLGSLAASSYPNKAIVIDNGSTDDTVVYIKKKFPRVSVIETGKNLGFGQGNNIGLTMALENKADYVFLLNQDAWIEYDTLSGLIEAHTNNREYGVLSPVHINGTGTDFDRYFYYYLVRSDIKNCMRSILLGSNETEAVINTKFVNAAAWLISFECLEKTGGFDPVFFHYGEDDNYAHRVLYKGYKIGIVPGQKVFHDKEYKDDNKKNIRKLFRHDWIIYLHQACNIQSSNYKMLAFGRFCRYTLMMFGGIIKLNRSAIFYNFSMAKNIVFSFSKILKSRSIAMNHEIPHLRVNRQY